MQSYASRSAPLRSAAPFALSALLVACVEPNAGGVSDLPPGIVLEHPIVVLEAMRKDRQSGLGRIEGSRFTEIADGLALGDDPALSEDRGRLFVSVRDEGLVHEVDPATLEVVRTLVVGDEGGPPPNPQDVALDAAGRIWVTRFGQADLGVFSGDGGLSGRVDLASLADEDGNPEMAAIRIRGERAYVALERLTPNPDAQSSDEAYTPAGPGLVAVVDTESLEIVGSFELSGQNPFGRLGEVAADEPGRTFSLATPGNWGALSPTDGLELVDVETGSSELVLSEAALGASVSEALVVGPTEGYAIVAGTETDLNPTSVVAFDPSTKTVTRTLATSSHFVHAGLAVSGAYVAVGDRSEGEARIELFFRDGGARAASIPVTVAAPVALVTFDGLPQPP